MSDHIKVTAAPGSYQIRAGDVVLGTTAQALNMAEGSYPPVLYIPRSDVAMTMLRKTARQTVCPHKGACSYYSVHTTNDVLENAVWSYETPKAGMEHIAGYLAFYPNKITVEAV